MIHPRTERTGERGAKLVLIVGFLLLTAALALAHTSPAEGYEISIYGATPAGFWVGVGAALVASILTSFYAEDTRLVSVALLLGGAAVVAVVSLPVIRGYRFYGLSDSLTHLGWAKAIAAGEMSAFDLVYPGAHTLSVLVHEAAGIPVTQSILLTVLVFVLVYLVSIPLCVWILIRDRDALVLAAFSGFLLFFVNNISTYRMFHTYSLATMFFPFLVYLFLVHITGEAEDGALPSRLSAASVVLPACSLALVFFHPQVALNVFILVAAYVPVQIAYRRYRPLDTISGSRAVYGQAAFLGLALFLWAGQHPTTYNMADVLSDAIVNTILGAAQAGAIVQTQGDAASAIGVSLLELFVKLFLVAAIYTALSGGLVLVKFLGRLGRQAPSTDVAISYFAYGGIALVPFFLLHFLGHASTYFFRHVGFSMVIAAILGSIALYEAYRALGGTARSLLRPALVVVVAAMLALSLLTVFQSPYIYLPNHHVSDQQIDGYRTAFSHAPEIYWQDEGAVWFTGIRTGPGRYDDAIVEYDVRTRQGLNESTMLSGLPEHYAAADWEPARRDHYFAVTSTDREREVIAYNEIRYSAASFEAIDSQYGVHRVQSNGGFTLYYIDVSFAESA